MPRAITLSTPIALPVPVEIDEADGDLGAFPAAMRVLAPGRSFPARRPIAQLDRIVISSGLHVEAAGVHHSPLAAVGSDHLPVWAELELPSKDAMPSA